MEKIVLSLQFFWHNLAFYQLLNLSLDECKHMRNRKCFKFLLIHKLFSHKSWPASRYGQCANKDKLVLREFLQHILFDVEGLVSTSGSI